MTDFDSQHSGSASDFIMKNEFASGDGVCLKNLNSQELVNTSAFCHTSPVPFDDTAIPDAGHAS
eukprot:5379028-Karenia_brevis.AAC.1